LNFISLFSKIYNIKKDIPSFWIAIGRFFFWKCIFFCKCKFFRTTFFRLSRGVAVRSLVEFCIDDISADLRTTNLKSTIIRQLGWIDAPHTQNFEILKSLEQTQESDKFKITFEIFVKILDGLNFSKRCLLRSSTWFFFQNLKILKFS
jgi:hypothetical protein